MKKIKPVISVSSTGNFAVNLTHTKIEDAHKRFRLSDSFFKQLVDSLEEYCVFTTDLKGVISSWNFGAKKLLGYSEEGMIGKNTEIIFTPESWEFKVPQQENKGVEPQKKEGLIEYLQVRKNKTTFWAGRLVFPLKDKNKKICGFTTVIRDLTVRKNCFSNLELEKEKLINIFKNSPAFFVIFSGKNHVFEMVNKAYYELVGDRDLIGKPLLKAIPEVKGQGIVEALDHVFSTGKTMEGKEIIGRVQCTAGGPLEEKFVNFIYQPVADSNGIIKGVLAQGYDVTKQVLARKQVEETGERFHTLVDNIPNLVWMADESGWVFWYNTSWYKYTGTTPEQMEGWGWESVHDPAVLPSVLEKWQLSLTSGEPFEMIFPLKGADGIFRPFLTRINPIRDNEGNIYRWFGTNTDITKQKELERLKDDFLGMASHELKTPVTVMKAYAQMLEEFFRNKGDIEAAQRCGKMHMQVHKLTGLIDDLLDVTKIQSGKMHFHNTYFDFNELVRDVTEQLQLIAPNHIEVNLQKTQKVYTDRKRLRQVVANFITNAIKYSPLKEKIIVQTKAARGHVTLNVKDFGMGMSKYDQEKVFEKFYRVSGKAQNTYPGLGLGLYISSEVIKRIGGKIGVESVEGEGSVFYFTIPTVAHKEVNKAARPAPEKIELQN